MVKKEEPLKLPAGSVRAILALLLTLGILVYVLSYNQFPGELISLLGVVVGFYFGSRLKEDDNTGATNKTASKRTRG